MGVQDKLFDFISRLPISSQQNDSNKWSNIGFGEEITQVVSVVKFILRFLSGALPIVIIILNSLNP